MIRYKVYQDFTLSQEHLDALMLLYQPVLSYPAISLYLTLHSHARHETFINQRDLLKSQHVDEATLLLYRQELEQMGLVQTYQEDVLELVLNPCLTPAAFLSHKLYSRLFAIVVGHHQFAYYCDMFRMPKPQNLSREITTKFDVKRVSSWDLTSEDEYNKAVDKEMSQYQFDAPGFFKNFPLFPQALVTPDILKLVAEYGSQYRVSLNDMKTMLLTTLKKNPKVFDVKVFAQLIAQKHGQQSVDQVDNIYDLEPLSFLRHLQQFDVSHVDQATILKLQKRYDFENPVMNLLLETMLQNGNSINYSYGISIADPWVRQGVKDFDSAKQALSNFENRVSGRMKTSSSGVRSSAVQPVYSEVDDIASDDALAAFKETLNNSFGKDDE